MGVAISYFMGMCLCLLFLCVGFFAVCAGLYCYGLYKAGKQDDFINLVNWLDWRKKNGSESTDD